MKKWCYYCKNRGDIFKLPSFKRRDKKRNTGMSHCHCEREGIPIEDGPWGTLMTVFDTCEYFKKK